ncbi:hypothetical protein AVEN_3930-1 [Araneus ventricosus]|uniref:Uncharacterized protein n=1 Tax=Araneus ventricosus TaxID=182803 RepID=A0A4Y2LVD7_ARAVE|nr:hypothetical protein AVEN_3930-1 [Araneus ventricosus]
MAQELDMLTVVPLLPTMVVESRNCPIDTRRLQNDQALCNKPDYLNSPDTNMPHLLAASADTKEIDAHERPSFPAGLSHWVMNLK